MYHCRRVPRGLSSRTARIFLPALAVLISCALGSVKDVRGQQAFLISSTELPRGATKLRFALEDGTGVPVRVYGAVPLSADLPEVGARLSTKRLRWIDETTSAGKLGVARPVFIRSEGAVKQIVRQGSVTFWEASLAADEDGMLLVGVTDASGAERLLPLTTSGINLVTPVLGTVIITPTSINTSESDQIVQVDAGIKDSGVGVSLVFFTFRHPSEEELLGIGALNSGTDKDGVWRAEVYFQQFSPVGTWDLEIGVFDKNFAYTVFDPDKSVVVEGVGDSAAPELAGSPVVSPTSVDLTGGPGRVTVTAPLRDDVSGVEYVFANFVNGEESGFAGVLLLDSGDSLDGTWTGNVEVPESTRPGIWTLVITAWDQAFNIAEITTNATVQVGGGDVTPPTLVGTPTVIPTSIDVSSAEGTVTASARVTDDQSGVSGVEFFFVLNDTSSFWGWGQLVDGDSLDGTWRSEVRVPQNTEEGVYTLTVYLYDDAGNDAEVATQVAVEVGGGDTQGPALAGSVTLAPSLLDLSAGAQTARATIPLSDNQTGVAWASVWLQGAGDEPSIASASAELVSGDSLNGIWEAEIHLDQRTPPGTYFLHVGAEDKAGNFVQHATGASLQVTIQAPGVVSQPDPEVGAVGVVEVPLLRWQPADAATEYDVFLWPASSPRPDLAIGRGLFRPQFTPDEPLAAGTSYNWQVVARNAVGEAAGPIWNFTVRQLPDLVVSSVQLPPQALSGQTIEVRWTVTNNGGAATTAPAWQDALYLSSDTVVTPRLDLLLGTSANVSYLNPGESYVNTQQVVLPRREFGPLYILVQTDWDDRQEEESNENNVNPAALQVNIPPAPDLQISSLQVPAIAFSGEEISVQWTVRNAGDGSTYTNAWDDIIYLSSDPVLVPQEALDRSSLRQVRPNMQPDSSYTSSATLLVPDSLSGTLYVFLHIDAHDTEFEPGGEDNNLHNAPVEVTLSPPPDLVPTGIVGPASAGSGERVMVTWSVQNQGSNPTRRSWSDRLYLSPTPAFNPATAHVIGTFPSARSLATDSSYTVQREVQMPNGISGSYYFVVRSDWRNELFEGPFEGNNVMVGAAAVDISLSPWPDLRVSSADVSGTIRAGDLVAFTWRVENAGVAVAPSPWHDSLYVSSQATWDRSTARVLGSALRAQPLSPSATYVQTAQVRLPADVEGPQYFYVMADAGNAVYEHMDEGNNAGRSREQAVGAYPPVDLAVTGTSAPSGGGSGQTIPVEMTVTNVGSGRPLSQFWVDGIYLSEDDQFNADTDTLLQEAFRVQTLDPGQAYVRQLNVRLPDGITGTRYVIARTDQLGTLGDSNTANNVRASGPITVSRTPPPDLQVSSFDAPASLIAGQPVTLRWTVENQGEGATIDTLWSDHLVLSRTASPDRGQVVGSLLHRGGLAVGASYQAEREIHIPLYATGRYYLIVQSNPRGDVYEENASDNNIAAIPVNVTLPPPSDLVVTNIDVPASAVVGEEVTVSYTIQNQGTNPAVGRISNGIYFSANTTWEVDDPLLAVDIQEIDLAPGAAAKLISTVDLSLSLVLDEQGVVTGRMPGLQPGSYHAIVRADLLNNIPETDEANNATASTGVIDADVPVLPLGVPVTARWDFRNNQFYRVEVAQDVDLRIRLNRSSSFAGGVFVSHETMPSPSVFEFSEATLDGGQKEVLVPSTKAGRYFVLLRSDYLLFPEEEYTVTAEALSFSVASISPNRGGQGVVTTRIKGAGFRPGSRVFLRGPGGDVAEAEVLSVPSTVEIVARWTLTEVPLGEYTVVVRNDGSSAELADGFEVEPLRPPALELVRNTPSALLVDRPSTYVLQFRNASNVDIAYASITLSAPPTTGLAIRTDGRLLTRSMLQAGADSTVLDYVDSPVARFIPLVARDITVGEKLEVIVTLTPTFDPSAQFPLQAVWQLQDRTAFLATQLERIETGRRAVLNNQDRADPQLVALAQDAMGFAEFVLNGYVQLGLLSNSDVQAALNMSSSAGKGGMAYGELTAGKTALALAGSSCVEFFSWLACPLAIVDCFIDIPFVPLTAGASLALCAFGVSTSCLGIDVGVFGCIGVLSAINCIAKELICKRLVFSLDPNDILGPEGYGDKRWVAASQTLAYTIRFENDPELATAPAQVVRVTLPVDSTLDERTFRVGSFGFAGYDFEVPANTAAYSTRLDLRDSLGIFVDVNAGIDVQKREAFWVLRSVDPATGAQPSDPFAGFLAVNDSLGGGEGYVTYTIRPRRESRTGDIANAKANIVFDLNQPIETPPVFNTIDAGLPASQMAGYSGIDDSPQVELFWSAHDDPGGSGVRDYALYASKDNEPFQLFQSGLTGSSVIYPREEGHTYRFFVVASDQAGNVEASKQSAEVVVSTEPEGIELPEVFALGQNYPNPFNPTTTVPFDIAAAGDVEVVMYDVLGRRVEMLALGFMQPGRYRQQFNLGEYASGVYFYELRVRNGTSYRFRDVKRLVLVK